MMVVEVVVVVMVVVVVVVMVLVVVSKLKEFTCRSSCTSLSWKRA